MSNNSTSSPGHLASFDGLRIAFAAMVLFSHSFALLGVADPIRSVVTGGGDPGDLAVDGFFLISGYLITRSWISDPSVSRFLARRALRLYPAFVVASIFSVLLVGPLGASAVGDYFHALNLRQTLVGFLVLREPHTPAVFAGTTVGSVNGSMWTISFEARCYLLAMLLGLAGMFRKRTTLLILTVIVGSAISYAVPEAGPTDNQHVLFGIKAVRVSDWMAWFAALFLTGSCFFVFRSRIRFTLWGLALAMFVLAASLFSAALLRPGILLGGAYVVFALASIRRGSRAQRRTMPDVSYGMYLYGWPVQKLLGWYIPHMSPWLMFVLSLTISAVLGWLSWTFIERPALKKKPHRPLAHQRKTDTPEALQS
ncbi:peptidoglycan/LPS O-acetylase OafA/YrhL [Paraburkholderia sp. GAS33]|uniref:acyltransferase family protein n=1 Tax=Paraburkholderia sp. GAS33 TaxID=3035130 RepID=UPI003D2278B9